MVRASESSVSDTGLISVGTVVPDGSPSFTKAHFPLLRVGQSGLRLAGLSREADWR